MDQLEKDVQAIVEDTMKSAIVGCTDSIGSMVEAAITKAMEVATKEAEKKCKQEQKAQYDWKYHNTKLLLKNYRRLSKYFDKAVFNAEEAQKVDESFESLMRSMTKPIDNNTFVESIQSNYVTTKIIMTHVNRMLDCYKLLCENSHRDADARRWRILDSLYLADDYTTAEEIAEREYISKRTLYKDVDVAIKDLTVLLFGVGGMEYGE